MIFVHIYLQHLSNNSLLSLILTFYVLTHIRLGNLWATYELPIMQLTIIKILSELVSFCMLQRDRSTMEITKQILTCLIVGCFALFYFLHNVIKFMSNPLVLSFLRTSSSCFLRKLFCPNLSQSFFDLLFLGLSKAFKPLFNLFDQEKIWISFRLLTTEFFVVFGYLVDIL